MKIEYFDHIGFYHNVFPDDFCSHLIQEFDYFESTGVGSNRFNSEGARRHIKDDYQISLNGRIHSLKPFKENHSVELFFEGLQKCYEEYISVYSSISENIKLNCSIMKMQKTYPGGGYHVWHFEQGPGMHANRVLVYILYLNSLKNEGGETEFLYQRKRIEPEENLMLIWPASFTHTHRGNPVLGNNNKYIVTGWFHLE